VRSSPGASTEHHRWAPVREEDGSERTASSIRAAQDFQILYFCQCG
jgi:hypothetical protein